MSTGGPRPCFLRSLRNRRLAASLPRALDQDIKNEALLVHRTPEPMPLPGDADDDLIEVPLVATARRSPTDAAGEFPAEFQAPLPDRLVGHRDAAGGQHLLEHAQAQRKPKIQPDRVADDLSRVAMADVNRVSRRPHPSVYPTNPAPTKSALGQLDGAGSPRRNHTLGGCQLRD